MDIKINKIKNQIIQCDALDLLRKIKDSSVDLIFCDPPYFRITKKYWDNQWNNEKEYLSWLLKWVKESQRVMKNGASIYICGTTKTNTFLKTKLVIDEKFDLTYQNEIIWCYNWGGRRKDNFPRKHENIWVYSKGKKAKFYPDSIRVPYTLKKSINPKYPLNRKGTIPVSWWQMQISKGNKNERIIHPTQKPQKLLERIIKAHTIEGDVVLDFFAGSFTTAIVSKMLNRNFICCDFDKEYVNLAKKRIKNG